MDPAVSAVARTEVEREDSIGAEVMSLVVALSCSSCALRLRDVGEEVSTSMLRSMR